ncbi:Ku protein [Actinokineospora sp. G85]|uniref:non-homologous end joining protein Ku n=1 Tax=Actinokineospora sp. G85 TaxID=3406626 RepID=UPI003C710A15
MARPIWHGAINFGLVTVPVDMFGATEDHTTSFRQFERGTADRIRYKRVNERTGEEVAYGDIVKGAEVGDGEYVIIEPEELDQIAPGRSRTIDISSFVALDEIDPIHFQKTYWLAPAKEEYGKAYGLLLQAMRKTGRAGIAHFVMRGKEYLTAVRAGDDDLLLLTTLLFAEDLRDPAKELKSLPEITPARGRELDMATTLIDSMTDTWTPEDYEDTYARRVEKLIEDKKAGREVVAEAAPATPTKVVDLFEALSKSVESRKRRRSDTAATPAKRAAAKPSVDLGSLTKAELDKMARELDVKGRSKMTRDQLQDAVATASTSAQAS